MSGTATPDPNKPKVKLTKANAKESFIRTIYDKVNSVLGNDNQLFTMEFPARSLNPADFEYSTTDRTSIVTKPYSVREKEFRLVDDLFNVSRITGGPNGEKLSTVFDTVINNYVPDLKSDTKFARDKALLRRWLTEEITFHDRDITYTTIDEGKTTERKERKQHDSKEVKSSRIAFCEKLMNRYLEEKLIWEREKNLKFDALRDAAKGDAKILIANMDEYARWLSSEGLVRDEMLNQFYNDAVVRGNLHEVMTFLGFLNAATTAEALESTKQFMRNSSRLSFDSSSKVYPVSLSPSNWFKALRPNFSPKDLTMSKEILALQYRNKTRLLEDLTLQQNEFTSLTVDEKKIEALEVEITKAKGELDEKETAFKKAQSTATLNAAKLAWKAAQAATDKSSFFKSALKEIFSPADKSKTEEGSIEQIYEDIEAVMTAMSDLLNKEVEHSALKAKKLMMESHNFKSQIEKIKSQINLVTADIKYLEPLVGGTMAIAQSDIQQSKEDVKKIDGKSEQQWAKSEIVAKSMGTFRALGLTIKYKQKAVLDSDGKAVTIKVGGKDTAKMEDEKDGTGKPIIDSIAIKTDTKGFTLKLSTATATAPATVDDKDPKSYEFATFEEAKLEAECKQIYDKYVEEYKKLKDMGKEGIVPKALLPDSDLDISDLSFSDIIISNEDSEKSSQHTSSVTTTETKSRASFWFTSYESKSSKSEVQTEFESKALSSKFECGFRVAKVTIDRGGWFNPTLLKMSSAFYHLAEFKAGSGLSMKDMDTLDTLEKKPKIEGDDVKTLADITAKMKALLPAFPVAFVIAKDITIKITNSEVIDNSQNAKGEGNGVIGGGFGPWSASSVSTNSSVSESAYSGVHGDSLYIRIPGPQILGWYQQFTAEDKSTPYDLQANNEGNGAIDILTLDDETILTEIRLRREELERDHRDANSMF